MCQRKRMDGCLESTHTPHTHTHTHTGGERPPPRRGPAEGEPVSVVRVGVRVTFQNVPRPDAQPARCEVKQSRRRVVCVKQSLSTHARYETCVYVQGGAFDIYIVSRACVIALHTPAQTIGNYNSAALYIGQMWIPRSKKGWIWGSTHATSNKKHLPRRAHS